MGQIQTSKGDPRGAFNRLFFTNHDIIALRTIWGENQDLFKPNHELKNPKTDQSAHSVLIAKNLTCTGRNTSIGRIFCRWFPLNKSTNDQH